MLDFCFNEQSCQCNNNNNNNNNNNAIMCHSRSNIQSHAINTTFKMAVNAVCELRATAGRENTYFPMIVHCFIKNTMNLDSSIFTTVAECLRLVLYCGRLQVKLRSVAKLCLIFIVLNWNDRAKHFTECVFHFFPGIPPS